MLEAIGERIKFNYTSCRSWKHWLAQCWLENEPRILDLQYKPMSLLTKVCNSYNFFNLEAYLFRSLQIQMLEIISKYSNLLKNTKQVLDNKHFHATIIDHKDNYMILILLHLVYY
jgi:hypothetical protein